MANSTGKRPGWRRLAFFLIPITIGIGIFIYMSMTRQPPSQKPVVSQASVVRVIKLTPMNVLPRTFGYGTAAPIRVWKAIAQVSGKIIYTHPQLQKGKGIQKGTVLVRIDPSEYKIAISQLNTQIEGYRIQLKEQEVLEKNNLELLKIQQQTLDIKKKEVDRQKKLYERRVISANEYEAQLQSLMGQQAQVQSIQNSLNLVPHQKGQLNAQIEQAMGDLENARLQLSYTEIKAPFDAQIATVNNKTSEFIQKGQTIFEANDISSVEIEAQFVPGSARPIFISLRNRIEEIDMSAPSIGREMGVSAIVRIPGEPMRRHQWPAELNRFSDTMDTETRTMGLIFVVKNEISLKPRERKRPLISGTYCEVELRGNPIKNVLVIPRSALHPGSVVYLMKPDSTLEKRVIETGPPIENFILVRSGIKAGETLILSDVIPAVDGMKLAPVKDREALEKLKREAEGT